MIDVIGTRAGIQLETLHAVAKAAFGAVCSGASMRKNESAIHLLDTATSADITAAGNLLAAQGTLVVTTNKASITADDTDTVTITCSDNQIAGDVAVGYRVYLDGEVYSEGQATVTGGVATLTLKTDIEGTYQADIFRLAGNRASGTTMINAVEA